MVCKDRREFIQQGMMQQGMIQQDVLVRSVTAATADVFSMILDMQVELTVFAADSKPAGNGLISLVGITGNWGGSGVFCCTPALAMIICDRLLGGDRRTAIDEEVLDVEAEVTNMMIGNIKNALESVTGPLAISVPAVIHGRNFQFRSASGLTGTALAFGTEGEPFEVRVELARASQQVAARGRIPVPGLAQV